MRFGDYFTAEGRARGGRPVISFEVFPPKTEKAMAQLDAVLPRLTALKPSFMTVTYGAFGSTQVRTVEVASRIRRKFRVETACHLTCVGMTRAEIDGVLSALASAGIENIVALRGDPPQGEAEFVAPAGGFAHANELVAYIHGRGDFALAVAGYPEKHIEAPDLATDLSHLKQKVDAGADVVITQLFYDNEHFFAFEKEARARGVDAPIVPGILPVQSFQQIERIASLCGATIPASFRRQLEAAGDDMEKVREAGVRWSIAQCRELLEHGVPGIHFYVLNRAAHMERIVGELRASGHLGA